MDTNVDGSYSLVDCAIMFMILSSSDRLSFRSPVRADEAMAGAAEGMVGADEEEDEEEGSLAKNGGGS